MKKFLSVLLALAVAFTFTFGSTMSAFAAPGDAYDKTDFNEQKVTLAAAKGVAYSLVEDTEENYDNLVIKSAFVDDITTYTITKADFEKAVDAAYDAKLSALIGGASLESVLTGDRTVDKAVVAKQLVEDAKDAANYIKAEKNALEGYKAYLCSLVDKIDTSIYTDTVQKTPYTVNGTEYKTSIEAAEAWKAFYKAKINNAVIDDATVDNTTPSAIEKWELPSTGAFKALYTEVFANPDTTSGKKVKVVKVLDDADSTLTTELTYKLGVKIVLATKAQEEGDAATLAATRAAKIAELAKVITEFKAGNDYVAKKHDAEINAYVEATTYLINNSKKDAIAGIPVDMNITIAKGTDYTKRIEAGKTYKEDMATAKTTYTTLGYKWDEEKAADAEVKALLSIYKDTPIPTITVDKTYLDTNLITSTDLTASAKAKAKVDYSEVEAVGKDFGGKTYGEIVYKAPVTVYNNGTITPTESGTEYFAKQWDAVKAAYDKYNAAVDAAVTVKDIESAAKTLSKDLAKIDDATAVYNKVSTATDTFNNINKYAKLVAGQAQEDIYVTFVDTEKVDKTGTPDLTVSNVYVWMINQGASTKTEAEALYNDAKAVIDGYKTLDTLKAEAAAVDAKIAALPAKPALTDKVAVIDAFDAYDALPETAKDYVVNKTTLDKAVGAVKVAEEYALKTKVAELPKITDVTVADKEALKTYKDAYKAYANTSAYTSKIPNPYDVNSALKKVKDLEAKAIRTAYNALAVKYQANKLTAEDVAAVEALQDALAAYIDEYAEDIREVDEFELSKIAATVATIAPAYDDQDAKADLLEMDRKITIWRTSPKSIRVTVKGSVKNIEDNGYTVKYRFYKKNPGAKKYTLIKTTSATKYTYTNLKKGGNRFQVKVSVYDKDGNFVASKMTYYRYAKIK